jgi:hypothetical protein
VENVWNKGGGNKRELENYILKSFTKSGHRQIPLG